MNADELHEAKEDAKRFSHLAGALFDEAKRQCAECPDSDIEYWLEMAKKRGMTWVEALEWVTQMRSSR